MKNQKLLLFAILLYTSSLFGQVNITGHVIDEQGDPLPFANVIESKSNNGTTTDLEGNFNLTTKFDEGEIIVSFIGFKDKKITFSKQKNNFPNIQLEFENNMLDEVIVVVGYKKKRLKDATEAISKIKDVDQLSESPILNAEEILQGNAAGVTVVSDGGDPTKSPNIKIRGVSSLRKDEPLIVVDGIPELPMPNPADIESINILKDASASIYGVRAASGVILVTTKKGDKHKTSVNVNVYGGIQSVSNKLKTLTTKEYIEVMSQAHQNDGTAKSKALLDLERNIDKLPDNNWVDMIFRNGFIKNYDVSFAGGGEKSRFYLGLNHKDTEGILLNSYVKKSALRVNSDFKLHKNLTIGENFALTYTNGNYGINTTNNEKGAIFVAMATRAFHPVTDKNGKYQGDNDLRNPYAYLTQHDDKRPSVNLTGNIFLEYNFLKHFTFLSKLGGNKTLTNIREFKSPEERDKTSYLYRANYDYFSWLTENSIAYKTKINDKHSIDLLVGHASQRNTGYYFGALAKDFPKTDKKLHYLDTQVSAKNRKLYGEPLVNNSLLSFIGRADYAYDNRYYFTATVRRDGSSKLPKENRWGTFPSFSLAWRPSNEAFIKNISWINDLKLRLSYGRLGNIGGLGDFDYKEDISPRGTFTLINGKWVDGIKYNKPRNKDLQWEESVQTNIGLDGELIDKSLYFSLDYFMKKTEKMLFNMTLPYQRGFESSPLVNFGEVENKGFEALIGYKKSYTDFSFDVSTNFSIIKNKITDLGGLKNIKLTTQKVKDLDPINTSVGHPINSFYVIETDGIFNSKEEIDTYTKNGQKIQPHAKPGDLKFVDANNDGKIDDKDRVFKGNSFPDVSFGLNINTAYKRFELSMLWQGALGVNVFNGLKHLSYVPRNSYNMASYIKNAWTPNNKDTDMPRVTLQDKNGNYSKVSDWFLEDASYLRLKNITLGYHIPISFINAKVYVTGKNVLTFTKYTGFDPEVDKSGIDVGYYPTAKSVILGLNLKF